MELALETNKLFKK